MKKNIIYLLYLFLSTYIINNSAIAKLPDEQNNIITNASDNDKNNKILSFDWDKFYIGSAEYPEGPTGCTVFYFPDRNINAVVDIRGSSVGSVLTNDLEHGGSARLDAIVLAGGSVLGVEAASGVSSAIFKEKGYNFGWGKMPLVAGSVIFDWINRYNPLYPDKNLGIAAYRSAKPGKFLLGKHGAGINARIAKVFGKDYSSPGGQGGAIKTFGDIKIAVFTVVNALGAIYDENGKMAYGYINKNTKSKISESELLAKFYPLNINNKKIDSKGNTTLTVIVINASLDLHEMQLMAKQMHNSFNEVIRPFGTSEDGDTLYFVSTKEVEIPQKDKYDATIHLGILATQVIKEAIYSAFQNN